MAKKWKSDLKKLTSWHSADRTIGGMQGHGHLCGHTGFVCTDKLWYSLENIEGLIPAGSNKLCKASPKLLQWYNILTNNCSGLGTLREDVLLQSFETLELKLTSEFATCEKADCVALFLSGIHSKLNFLYKVDNDGVGTPYYFERVDTGKGTGNLKWGLVNENSQD